MIYLPASWRKLSIEDLSKMTHEEQQFTTAQLLLIKAKIWKYQDLLGSEKGAES